MDDRTRAPATSLWMAAFRVVAFAVLFLICVRIGGILLGFLVPDGALRYSTPHGKRLFIEGRVLEIVPGSRLVHQFRFVDLAEPPQTVVFEIEQARRGTHVVIHHHGLGEAPRHRSRVTRGWSHILRNLKAWLEQGRLPVATRVQYAVLKLLLPLMPAPAGADARAHPPASRPEAP